VELADFALERVTFEVRFEKAFALWDRAGATIAGVTAQYPNAELQDANPSRIALVIKPNAELVLELEKAHVIHHAPQRDAAPLIPLATSLTKSVTEFLQVKALTRIGTRAIYKKEFDKIADATQRLLSMGHLRTPTGKFFGVDAKPESVAYSTKWDGKATGVRVSLHSQTQKIEFSPAPIHAKEMEGISKERHELLLDIDYFSTQTVMSDQFRAEDWIKNAMHLINRDVHFFLKPL
jgi:hypothetical protein